MNRNYFLVGIFVASLILFFLFIFSESKRVRNSYNFKKEFSAISENLKEESTVNQSSFTDLFKSLNEKADKALSEVNLLKDQFNSLSQVDKNLFDSKLGEMKTLVKEIEGLKDQILNISSKSVFSDSESFLKINSKLDDLEKKLKNLNDQFLLISSSNRTSQPISSYPSDSLIAILRSEISNLSSSLNGEIGRAEGNSRVLQEHSRKISEISARMRDIDSIVVVVYRHLLSVQDSVFTEMVRLRAGGS